MKQEIDRCGDCGKPATVLMKIGNKRNDWVIKSCDVCGDWVCDQCSEEDDETGVVKCLCCIETEVRLEQKSKEEKENG